MGNDITVQVGLPCVGLMERDVTWGGIDKERMPLLFVEEA